LANDNRIFIEIIVPSDRIMFKILLFGRTSIVITAPQYIIELCVLASCQHGLQTSVIFVNETKTRTKMIRQSFTKARMRTKKKSRIKTK